MLRVYWLLVDSRCSLLTRMGRKRERERDREAEGGQPPQDEPKQASSNQSSITAQAMFHLPTPRPQAVVQSAAVSLQFHLPSPRPPLPVADATPAEPLSQQQRRDTPSPAPAAVTRTPTQQPQSVISLSSGKKKRKHRKRKATAPPPQPVDQSLPLPAVPIGQYHVFVGGLPYAATKQQVTQYFQRDGCYVWDVRLAQYGADSDWAGEGRGFCHVELENELQVARTLLRHGELWSDGESRLTVQLAKPKYDRQHTVDEQKQAQ